MPMDATILSRKRMTKISSDNVAKAKSSTRNTSMLVKDFHMFFLLIYQSTLVAATKTHKAP
jgi:hypothetical protein